MKIFSKFAVILSVLFVLPQGVCAQDKIEAYLGADLLSRYMWRGQHLGDVSIQPQLSVGWKGLKINAEGNIGFESKDTRELDVTLEYSKFGFNIGVTDYWTSGVDENNRYFYYPKHGPHQLEGNLGYSCKYFSLQAYSIFWGNDFKISGEQAYSTYIELGVPFKLGGVDWEVKAGMTPFKSAGYTETTEQTLPSGVKRDVTKCYYFYAEGAACVMASIRATKNLDLTFAELPVFAELHANPYLQTADLLFGVTICPFK